MSKSYKQNQVISYYMCDRNRQLTLSMLVNVLMEVSENHSADLGREESYMTERGISWIILRYEFSIERMPKYKEAVDIETFATEYNKLFTYREFIVRDKDNNEIIHVKTTFAVMNNANRKMTRIPSDVVEPYGATFSKRIRRDSKPKAFDGNQAADKQYMVRYFDIDPNQHVNNSKYFEWLLDTLGPDFLTNKQLKHGVITFDKEVKEGDAVISRVSKRKEDDRYTDHRIFVGETMHASASFRWGKKTRMEYSDGNDQ